MRILGRRVLIKVEEPQEQRGSVYIPKIAQRRPQSGVVIAKGDQVESVEVGDRVIYPKFNYETIEGHGILVWERDLVMVLE